MRITAFFKKLTVHLLLLFVIMTGSIFAQDSTTFVKESYPWHTTCVVNKLVSADSINAYQDIVAEIDYLREHRTGCEEQGVVTRRLSLRLMELGDQEYGNYEIEQGVDKKSLFEESLMWAKVAVNENPNSDINYENLSMAFAAMVTVSSLRKKVQLADSVRIYAEKAIEINPQNDRVHHILGRWHYEVSKFSWILRRLSKLIFGHSPDGSFELAIKYFNNALELKNIPLHRYWLGMVYLESGQKEEALVQFRQVLDLENVQHNDEYFKREAQRLIEKHG